MSTKKIHQKYISSWGNLQKIRAKVYPLTKQEKTPKNNFIPHGNGRSYGDSSLNDTVLVTKGYNKVYTFDVQKGIIHCQSGILLHEILEEIIPKGWFLPVTPGTKYITLGGAIAADVHGKNHHHAGCFSRYIIYLKLRLPNGKEIRCSKTENSSFFEATCGGIGLTGVIMEVCFRLKKIKNSQIKQTLFRCKNLQTIFATIEKNKDAEYAVAWIDALQKNTSIGKGVVFLGQHSKENDAKTFKNTPSISIPKSFPSFLLNTSVIKLYNRLYYHRKKEGCTTVHLQDFFYPLDKIKNWNRIYGRKGLVQYQFVIPKANAFGAIFRIIQKTTESPFPAFLCVLKLFGPANENYLSFPLEGYTLTMDFKMKKGLHDFLKELDDIVVIHKGRIYLVKDVRMPKALLDIGYHKASTFRKFRKENALLKLQSFQSKRLGL